MTADGDATPMTFTATAAYPYAHEERATAALHSQLREIATAAGERPDWSTLVLVGPTESAGAHGRTWFQWVATVEAVTAPVDRDA